MRYHRKEQKSGMGMMESAQQVDRDKYCQNKRLMRYPKREEDLEIMTNPKYLALLNKVKTDKRKNL